MTGQGIFRSPGTLLGEESGTLGAAALPLACSTLRSLEVSRDRGAAAAAERTAFALARPPPRCRRWSGGSRSYGSRRRRRRPSLKPAPPRAPLGPRPLLLPRLGRCCEPLARSPTRYWGPREQDSAIGATCACEQPAPRPGPNHVSQFHPLCSQCWSTEALVICIVVVVVVILLLLLF